VPPVTGVLVINPGAGTDNPSAEELAEAARSRGIEVRLLAKGDDVVELTRSAEAEALDLLADSDILRALRDLPEEFGNWNFQRFRRWVRLHRSHP